MYFCQYKIASRGDFDNKSSLPQSGEKTRNSFFMKKEKRILKYDIRLTEEELEQFKKKAEGFSSVSSMIRIAVEHLDDRAKKSKIDLLDEFSALLRKYDLQFSHVAGNLNQVVKRANLLSLSHSLDIRFLEEVLYPQIIDTNKLIIEIKQMQKSIFSHILKL